MGHIVTFERHVVTWPFDSLSDLMGGVTDKVKYFVNINRIINFFIWKIVYIHSKQINFGVWQLAHSQHTAIQYSFKQCGQTDA